MDLFRKTNHKQFIQLTLLTQKLQKHITQSPNNKLGQIQWLRTTSRLEIDRDYSYSSGTEKGQIFFLIFPMGPRLMPKNYG